MSPIEMASGLSARSCVLAGLLLLGGCIPIPRFEPSISAPGLMVRDPQTGNYRTKKLDTMVVDTASGRTLSDALAIIVISRSKPSLSEAMAQPPPIAPEALVMPFNKLGSVRRNNSGLDLYPLGASGTEYGFAGVVIYRPGYRPVPLKPVSPEEGYPREVRLSPCPPEAGRNAAIELAVASLSSPSSNRSEVEMQKAAARKDLEAKVPPVTQR